VSANEQIVLCILNWNGVNESFLAVNNTCRITKSVSSGSYTFAIYANDTSNNTGYAGSRTFTVSSPPSGGGGGGGGAAPTPTPTPTPTLPVHNLNTGENFSTIQAAIDDSDTKDGDTIVVDPGNYTENVVVTKSLKIVSAEGPEKTVVKAAGSDYVFIVKKSNTTISGFTITGAPCDPIMYAGVLVSGVSNCTISNNRIVDNPIGIYFHDTTNSTIANNLIENNCDGIDLENGGSRTIMRQVGYNTYILEHVGFNTITGNVIKHNSGYGIWLWDSNYNLIYNNYFNNSNNLHLWGSSFWDNKWNVTKTVGENIIGGIYIGGNYWSNYNGKDIDGDGIGDTNVPFGPGDYLPLVNLPVLNVDTGKRFQKIQQAIDDKDTKDGDTILLSPTTYVENLVINKGVKIKSNGAIIRAKDSSKDAVIVEAKGVTLDGLRIDGNSSGTGINVKGDECHIFNSTVTNSSTGVAVSSIFTVVENTTISFNEIGVKIAHPDDLVFSLSNRMKLSNGNEKLVRYIAERLDKGEYLASISNCTVSGNREGIVVEKSFKVKIFGNRIEDNKLEGILVKYCEMGLFRNNYILHNDFGLIFDKAKYNVIYNNYFDNHVNAIDNGDNEWNITKTQGKNIVGGPYLGGNYWSDYRGYDWDMDELGNELYVISDHANRPNGKDYLPLMKYPVHNIDLERNYPTIQAAVDDARPNDRIVVDPGVYEDNVVISKPVSITINRSAKLGDVIVQARFSWYPVFRITSDNVTISGFIICGSDIAGISMDNVRNCKITKNRVRDNKIGVELLNSTSNKIISNYIVDNELGIKLQNSGNNEIYDNFFSNDRNVESNGNANWWSSVKEWSKRHNPPGGENIIHGDKIKGNYWSDFSPSIHNHIYYPYGDVGSDILPLTYSRTSAIHISSNDGFTFANGVLYGTGSKYDPYVIEACDFNFTKYPNIVENSIWIENTNAYFEIKNCKIDTALTGIYLKNVKNGKLFNIRFKTGFSGQFMVRINSSSNIDVYRCKFGPAQCMGWTIAALACKDSTSVSVRQNDISGVPTGVLLESSSNILISDNTICPIFNKYDSSQDFKGVSAVSSNNVVLRNNTINSATYGISASSSSDITINGGVFENSYYTPQCGESRCEFWHASRGGAILMSNVDGAGISNITAENNYDGVIIEKSSHITVKNSTIAHNKNDGIRLKENTHAYITLFNNVITSNTNGLRLYASSNNTIYSNYFLDNQFGISFSGSSGNLIYNNYLDNENNIYGSTAGNRLNISKTPGKNIIGGFYLGGNYWSDYNGVDMDGDKLGDTPFHGDMHPLMNTTNIHITSNSEFDSAHGVSGGSGTENDPYIIEDKVIDATTTHGIWIENTTAYFVIRNVSIDGKLKRTNGIYLINVKNGRFEDVSVNNTNYSIYMVNSSNVQIAGADVGNSNYGVYIVNSTAIQLNDSRIHNNEIGVLAVNSDGVNAHGCIITSNHYGIKFNSTSNGRIENCSLVDNHYTIHRMETVYIGGGYYNNVWVTRWMGGGIQLNSSSNVDVIGNNITTHFSEGSYVFHSDSGILVTGSENENIMNNSVEGYEYGVKVVNSSTTVENNEIVENMYGIFSKDSNVTVENNTMKGFKLVIESTSVGIYADNSTCWISKNRIESFRSRYFDISGNPLWKGKGIYLNSSSAILAYNIILSNGEYGVYAKSSSISVTKNTISDNKVGVYFPNSYGLITDNYITNAQYGIDVRGTLVSHTYYIIAYPMVYIFANTIAECSNGLHYSATHLSSWIRDNRIYGCEKGIFLENAGTRNIDNNAIYNNNYDVYVVNSTPTFNQIYTGTNNLTTNDNSILGLNPLLEWDRKDFGSPILRASILNVTSTQFGVSKDVGDMISVYVHADSAFGFTKEKLYLVDSRNSTMKYELYSKSVSGNVIDKAIALPILNVNDSTYDMYYEVTDSMNHKAYSLVRVNVKNLDLHITNVTTTFAKRIYSWIKASTLQYHVNYTVDKFPVHERGSFINVTVKNNGVKGGFARLEVVLPDFLHNVTQNPVEYLYLNASEEKTYSFYILLTKYDRLKGWKPKPSAFPQNKEIPITVKLQNFPSYTLADSKQTEIHFKLGPIFEIRKPSDAPIPISSDANYSYVTVIPKSSNKNTPYDGDGDNVLEAAESHHFNLYFINVGDEPANITEFRYYELIPCNASKYITNPLYRYSNKYIMHSNNRKYCLPNSYLCMDHYWWEQYSGTNAESYYYPGNEAIGDTLFGMLYPNGTKYINGNLIPYYNREKKLINGWIDWWDDRPNDGVYPPADYTGNVITFIQLRYSTGDEPYGYFAPSINTIPINVKALEKTFIPSTYTTSDIKLKVYSVDAKKGTVHMTMQNLNDYVYFEYRADGLYGSQEGYKWYHVLPPEYKFNVFAQNAKDPSKSIPHLKAIVGAKWSLWANELKLGLMGAEAVVNIILDEVTGGAVEVEFADTVMGATNTMLQIMNAVESISNNVTPSVNIDGLTFNQTEIDNLADHGLNQTYFNRIKNGDIDSGMMITFIKAAASDDNLKKVFQREVLKAIAKNLGLEELYKRLNDPDVLEDDFDNFKDALLEELVENKKLTKEQAEKIDKAVEVAKIFIDLGEWAYNNYNAEGMRDMVINVLDPPSNYTVEIEEKETNYFGGYYTTQADVGNGNVTIDFLNDSLVKITGVYHMNPENASVPLNKIRKMYVSLKGERKQNKMIGDAYMEIIPKPSEMLNAVSAFRNPSVPRLMISSHFVKIYNITTVTEGDRITVHAHGILRCQDNDVFINGTTIINESLVTVRIEKIGHYATEKNGTMALNVTFGPVIGISLNNTQLNVLNATNLESDLPFKKVGNAYHLEHLPSKLTVKAEVKYLEESNQGEIVESESKGLPNYYVIALIVAAIAVIAVAVVLKRR